DPRPFLAVADEVYRGDPAWVPPLQLDMRERLDPKKNPFFQHAEATLFSAWRDGRPVGRISAQIDQQHLEYHDDGAGFFGFFDTLEDPEAARLLVEAAADWLRARGMRVMRGPMSFTFKEEVGVLIDGFETPPMLLMGHSRPYQGAMAEAAGLQKVKDLYAWRYDVGNLPKRAERAWQQVQEMPELSFRNIRKRKLQEDLPVMMEIFNDAWSENWGFVPATDAEVRKFARDLRLIIDEELAFFAEIDGRPVAMAVSVPNLNEVIQDLEGRLLPWGLPKILWRLKVKNPKSARLMLLGIRRELRHAKRYGALSTAMYVEMARRGPKKGYEWGELSLTLEDNHPINLGIRAMGGKRYKTYRVFERTLQEATTAARHDT
ncbi:MAG: hypothetical protein ACPGUV_05610, partial [Polyangiales bacterium]